MSKIKYQRQVEQMLVKLLRQNPNWKAEASQIAGMLTEEGLLLNNASTENVHQFAQDVISDNPLIYENSNLDHLYEIRWKSENAENALDLVSWLIPAESA